jgi:CheY-like chemotaxis protein
MRMPPGIDGLETAKRLRSQDPEINIVFVTGYSDRPPSEISRELGGADRLFYLVKPFDPDEVLQLISTLVVRWRSEQDVAASIVRVHSELVNLQKELARSEAESKDLREQVEQLRLQDSMAVRRHARDAEDAAENPVSSGVAPVVPRISTEAIRAAYSAGQAAYDRPDGLGLCPYSPIAETALFSAWVEGYRSREGPSSSRL